MADAPLMLAATTTMHIPDTRTVRALPCLTLAALLALGSAAWGQQTLPAEHLQGHPVMLAVTFNDMSDEEGTVFWQDPQGRLFAPLSFLEYWNLRQDEERATSPDGTVYVDLAKIPGLSHTWDHEHEILSIHAPADAFTPTSLNIGADSGHSVSAYTPGAFLKYDLSLTRGPGIDANQGYFQAGMFRGESLLTSDFATGTAGGAGHVRLMSSWQVDHVERVKTLRVGDSYNNTGAWGRGVLFGGVQYGTNFSIRPDFVTLAMPSVTGKALLPSTVDIYVNNALRSRQKVNTGAFSIQNLPLITGSGDLQVVVKDMLGREQLISQSFFSSPQLLREGLVEDSVEFGWIRQNYGTVSNDYGDPFASTTWRKGLSPRLTAEWRAEVQRDTATTGASAAFALPAISSMLESSVALSSARGQPTGGLASLSWSYLGRRWSAGARLQLNSTGFRQLGSDPLNLLRQLASAQFSTPLGAGTLSMNYLQRLNQGDSLTRVINVSYSHKLGERTFASLTVLRSLSPGAMLTAGLSLSMILDPRNFTAATLRGQSGGSTLYGEFQHAVPRDEGTGYRLAALTGGTSQRQEASVTRNQSFGTLEAQLADVNGTVNTRLGARGGIALLAGDFYFSRNLDDGFAVVQVKDVPGVPVYLHNQVAGHTNRRGRAVVANLRPWQDNRISIDPLSLRMDMTIGEVEKIVVPRPQGGVLINFEVTTALGVTLVIVDADGRPLPAWTPVEVQGTARGFVIGMRGEVSVELPQRTGNRLIARPIGQPACALRVDLDDDQANSPDMKARTCTPIE
jgi:outer membrane usher protein